MTALRQRPIRDTGIRVTELGPGGAPLGHLYQEITGEQAAAATIDAAAPVATGGPGLMSR